MGGYSYGKLGSIIRHHRSEKGHSSSYSRDLPSEVGMCLKSIKQDDLGNRKQNVGIGRIVWIYKNEIVKMNKKWQVEKRGVREPENIHHLDITGPDGVGMDLPVPPWAKNLEGFHQNGVQGSASTLRKNPHIKVDGGAWSMESSPLRLFNSL